MSAADRLLNQGPELPLGITNGAQQAELIKLVGECKESVAGLHDAIYALHQQFLAELATRTAAFEKEVVKEWSNESRILAEKTINAALLAAQSSAVNLIRATKEDMVSELRGLVHGVVPEDETEKPPMPWLWIGAGVAVVVGLAVLGLFMFHVIH